MKLSIDNFDLDQFMRLAQSFGETRYGYVVTPNTDHLIRYYEDASFRSLYADASYVLLDSRFLSRLFRITQGLRAATCPGSDLTERLFDQAINPADRIVLIGGSETQAQLLAQRYGLTNLRHVNPPMGFIDDPAKLEECLRFVEQNSPFRFCFLAVGAPRQEALAHQLKARGLAKGLALCIGASVNFLTGVERRAPLWVQHAGLEWAYRLLRDPMRLAHRYLVRGPRIFSILPHLRVEIRGQTAMAPLLAAEPLAPRPVDPELSVPVEHQARRSA